MWRSRETLLKLFPCDSGGDWAGMSPSTLLTLQPC